MDSTPLLLQWLATSSPPTFLSLSQTSWCLLDSVGTLFFTFPQAHAYPAMLSLALKVMPITNTYIALPPPPSERAAKGSSFRSSCETLRLMAARYHCLFGTGLLDLMPDTTLHAAIPAEAQGLRTQLLVGPGTESALLRLTAACRSLHSQHTAKQKELQQQSCRSADMGTTRASSRNHSRSHKPKTGSSTSCSNPSNSSVSSAAQDEAASLLLPPDHQLMVAQFGECSVAALEAYWKEEGSELNFSTVEQIAHYVGVLGKSAEARSERPAFNEIHRRTEVTPAAAHASAEPPCLGSAAGLQLLLEVIGLLVAEGDCTGAVQIKTFDLLFKSVAAITPAERQVFLTARGGLLVQVFQLGLQADWERHQQLQLEGLVETEEGTMVFSMLKTMATLVSETPCNGETREVVAMYFTFPL